MQQHTTPLPDHHLYRSLENTYAAAYRRGGMLPDEADRASRLASLLASAYGLDPQTVAEAAAEDAELGEDG